MMQKYHFVFPSKRKLDFYFGYLIYMIGFLICIKYSLIVINIYMVMILSLIRREK